MDELIMQKVRQWLTQQGFSFVRSFETELSFPRLQSACVAAGVGGIEMQPVLHFAYLGKDAENRHWYGQRLAVTLVFDLYSPRRSGAKICDQLADSLINALLRPETPFYCRAVSAGEAAFDARLNAFHRRVQASICAWSAKQKDTSGGDT